MSDLWLAIRQIARPHPGWYALLAAIGLTLIGVIAIDTADAAAAAAAAVGHAGKQTQWLALSLVVAALAILPRPKQIGYLALPLLAFSLILLIIVALPFMPRSIVPVRNGIRAWIDLRFMMFQPSELAKVAFVLALAWRLRHRDGYMSFLSVLKPFVFMIVPVALILLQPDLGTAALFVPIVFAVLVIAGARLRQLAILVLLGLLMLATVVGSIYVLPDNMQALKPYQRARIDAMIKQTILGDDRYVNDVGYQQDRARTLIGAGGATGYGAERSAVLLRYNKLPEDHNDMIFAVIVNRWGFAGGALVLGLFAILLTCILGVGLITKDPFARLAVTGFAALLAAQTTINIGMAMGALPVIGITLPFVSYGGSSLMISYLIIGLVVNFGSRRPAYVHRPSFEPVDVPVMSR